MRTIKFRALRDDMSDCTFKYGQLTYGVDEITKKKFPRIHIPTYGGSNTAFSISCLPNTEGQFTGLCDKNGVEIYEGDIVKHDLGHKDWTDRLWVVVFEFSAFQLRTKDVKNPISFVFHAYQAIDNDAIDEQEEYTLHIEVIGNIHQHKELLK